MATIPGAESAYVDRSKVADYLLSMTHPDGRSKAEFLSRFGFTVEICDVLIAALLEIARRDDIVEIVESNFGKRYVVDGWLQLPDGTRPMIRTVWIIETGQLAPRFVTAYPP